MGAVSLWKFGANSIQDPDITGTGHQPMGHDQMALLYNKAIVIGSKITARFTNTDTDQQQFVGIYSAESGVAPGGDAQDFIENGASFATLAGASDGSPNIKTVSAKFSAKRNFGIVHPLSEADDIGAALGSLVKRLWHYIIWAASCKPVDTNVVDVCVFIQYLVIAFDPKIQPFS